MKSRPRVLTVRASSELPFERRHLQEERLRGVLRAALGDVLVRFEEALPVERDSSPHIRLTGPWTQPPEVVRRIVRGTLGAPHRTDEPASDSDVQQFDFRRNGQDVNQ